MSITERKNKDGTISFKIVASDGYKIDKNGHYVQVRKPFANHLLWVLEKLEK